ncbi:MAG: hypothetical protein JWL79_316 [Frankiales bacterium]|jgi:hypothetical protein|nr:hypothetical protein [Frankiales bacterium]
MDTGTADARLAAAVAAHDGTAPSHAALLAALVDAQVLVAITATSTSEHVEEGTGLRAESSAELAVVLVAGADGHRALPVFTSAAAMQRWRLDVRPVRLSGPQAAQAALDEGAVALLVEGSVSVTELDDVAAGWVPVLGSGLAARVGEVQLRDAAATSDDLVAALRAALAGERLRSARLLEGPDGLVLGVAPKVALGPAGLAALAQRVVGRLGDALPADGIDLAQVDPRGPGRELLRRTRWFS